MIEILVGAVLATALIYVGRCWARQDNGLVIHMDDLKQQEHERIKRSW